MITHAQLAGYAGLIIIPSLFIWLCVAWHLVYVKIEEVLTYFSNSSVITSRAWLKDQGPAQSLLLVGAITDAVTFPASYIKGGELDPNDLASLPARLRTKLVVMYWTQLGLVTALCLVSFPLMIYRWLTNGT